MVILGIGALARLYITKQIKKEKNMWIFTIVRTFFDPQDNWERTVTADSFKVLDEAKRRMIDIIVSSTGEHVGTYTLEYMENTNNINDLHATIEYKDGSYEVIQVLANWLE